MPDEPVDGFSDVQQGEDSGDTKEQIPGSPDPGHEQGAPDPLDPDERARLEKEINEGDQEGHHGHMPSES
jgi:hypothetical protein